MTTLATAISAIVLLLVGGAIGFYLARLGQSAAAAKAEEVQQDYDSYRAEVAEHFGKTAEQFHAIGRQYRDLYDHLAAGSAKLCELEAPEGGALFPPALEAAGEDIDVDEVTEVEEATAESESELRADEPEAGVDAEAGADVGQEPAIEPQIEDTVAEDDDTVVASTDDADEPDGERLAESVEEDEATPDNVVELLPRSDVGEDADKKSYS